ncbi:hypothetical protein AQJ91_31335 [Streptomyces dysideae]|uniref:Uncharacterized protein n=1 Tax=Streptomyces dysideae TaxID=909626 RepID=A0A101UV47_9ACTN|nr:hypothetical protein AQJ91_31335 [Streptomyces dysideae]
MHDVQAGACQQLGVEGYGVLAEEPYELATACLHVEHVGQRFVAQPNGLYVVEFQIAQSVERQLQGVCDGLQLGLVQRRLACLARRTLHELSGELA